MSKRLTLSTQLFTLITLVLVCAFLWQRQAVFDYFKLYGYTAPSPVSDLADHTTMTDGARRVFYVNHPAIQDRRLFNQSCSALGEQTIILGCYHPIDRGIFLFNVTDERLRGVDEVTAAHELLHAEYNRLSTAKRRHIDNVLNDYYQHQLVDARVRSIIEAYQRTEPKDVTNEMHSVFGTEIRDLPPELESYYRAYFQNRQSIVSYAESYQIEFTSRQSKVAVYDARLMAMKVQIDANSKQLADGQQLIIAARSRLESLRTSGDIATYNDGVPGYNASIVSYNQLVSQTKTLIDAYNEIVAERNQTAVEVSDLAHSIDSSFEPIKQTVRN